MITSTNTYRPVPHTPRRNRLLASTSILVLVGTLALHAQDTSINIPNPSFELSSPAQTSTNFGLAPGWKFSIQDGSAFGIASISSNVITPGASSGSNYAFINNDNPGVTDTITSASSLGTITPLTTYTLTVAIGNRNGSGLYAEPGNVSFSLLANGTSFASQEVTQGTVPNGTFKDFSLTFTTPAAGTIIGEALTIQLATLPEQSNAFQPGFDNVTLDAVTQPPAVVPEPSTWMLLAIGMFTLGCLIRRNPVTARATATAAALSLTAAMVHATPVNIPNASFDNPTTPTGGDGAPIPGWVFNSASGNLYGTSLITQSFTAEGAASGNNYAFMFNDVAGKTDTITSAASLGFIQSNTKYTLTVAIGNVGGSDSVSNHSPGNVSFSLLANGVAFATQTILNGTVPDATFEDFTLTFQTPNAGSIIGENLGIQLASLPTSGPGSGPAFDNVTLDATSIAVAPEPSTYALLLGGLLTLGWLTRRKLALA
jgi:hypothetical protein